MTRTQNRSGKHLAPDADPGAAAPETDQTMLVPRSAELPEDSPSFIATSGRGYSGKTTIEHVLAMRAKQPLLVADADRTNAGISLYVHDALRPASSDEMDVRALAMTLIDRIIEAREVGKRVHGMLDLGAGDRTLPELAYELRLTDFLTEAGIRPVLIHMVGPDRADLDMLKALEQPDVYAPPATAILFATRLLSRGARADVFQRLIDDEPVLQRAIERGAYVGVVPTLAQMPAVEALGVGFRDAAAGLAPPGKTPLGPTARQQVKLWLEAMEELLAPIAAWLP